MNFDWREGNQASLLEHPNAFFQRVLHALSQAQTQILFETGGIDNSLHGVALCQRLAALAFEGKDVRLRLDTRGLKNLAPVQHQQLVQAGVQLSVYQASRIQPSTRLHRQLVVVDQRLAFIGGHNFCTQLSPYGFAIELSGPIVADIRHLLLRPLQHKTRPTHWWQPCYPEPRICAQGSYTGTTPARLLSKEHAQKNNNLATQLAQAISAAQTQVSIITGHFCPTPELLRSILEAATRGVKVRIYIPKASSWWFARLQQSLLEHALQDAGVKLFTYKDSPAYGQVILIDQDWICLGSSNLDPQSLLRNLEADLLIRDHQLNQQLQLAILQMPCSSCARRTLSNEQQGLGLSQLMLDTLYYMRSRFAVLDRLLVTYGHKVQANKGFST